MQLNVTKRLTAQTHIGIIRWNRSYSSVPVSSPPQLHDADYQELYNLLQSGKTSMDMKTLSKIHSRIVTFGYGTSPSLMTSLMLKYVHRNRRSIVYKITGQVFCWSNDLVELNMIIDKLLRMENYRVAKMVFNKMPSRDVVTWNTMIGGYVRKARFEEALRLFRFMIKSNVEPDKFTFASVMNGCAKLGALKHAQWVHELLIEKRIELNFILSSALIDMYSKCSKIQTAKEIFDGVQRNNVCVWNAMISGLAVHGLALDAIKVFTKMEPKLGEAAMANISRLRSGDYVLLSNIYCSQKRWDTAQGVWEMMKKKGVRKVRGKSCFEWAGVLHPFKAGDRSHPETEEIYKMLEGLIQRTKLAGYVPTTDLVTMDVSEEEKEGNLYHHSEKLALAYGILKTTSGSEVRISKNLRICYDCHNWIKMVSRLLSRVIIVRDRIRFHQFENGLCSCGDYW
ncbi:PENTATRICOPEPTIDE REPEAT-CONTAINING PROTEIN [Salix koriyanagi]|uniref:PENTATRICOPEPTIDE REPEAT-CONTAINING PROTEIN n=1 Tax=Salix koriyanagi TaxID=2511006 RepID=A0A9Q1A8S2_9ROSI|nr:PENTATRICOPEPTIDE REPEAT-CONTAINING PROTEIN [Salix koriyanagi]